MVKEKEINSVLQKHFYKDLYLLKNFQDVENKDYCKTTLKMISEQEFAKKDGRMRGHDEFWNAISCMQMTP